MIRDLRIDFKDFKTRKIKSHGAWIFVSNDIDLKDLENDNIYTFEVSQLLDGRYVLEKLIKKERENG